MKGKQIWAEDVLILLIQEDSYLRMLVFDAKNDLNWTSMAEKINVCFPNKAISAKQCR